MPLPAQTQVPLRESVVNRVSSVNDVGVAPDEGASMEPPFVAAHRKSHRQTVVQLH